MAVTVTIRYLHCAPRTRGRIAKQISLFFGARKQTQKENNVFSWRRNGMSSSIVAGAKVQKYLQNVS